MIRPIEELMAYYAFTIEDAQVRKRPRLSARARAMAVEFEAIMKDPNFIRALVSRFGTEATGEELRQLANLYSTNFLRKIVDIDSPTAELESIDLAFESDVENFVRMQERDRLRKRFKALEEEVLMSSNDAIEPKLLSNERQNMAMFEEAEPPKEKTDEGNLWKIIFLIIALAVAAMLIRFVWVLFKP
jgi:hypothetical protein